MSEEFETAFPVANDAIWNEGKVELMDQYFTQDIVAHQPPFPDVEGLDAMKAFVADVRTAFPDFRVTTDEMIFERDTFAARWTWSGTHTGHGKVIPVPPTGKKMSGTGMIMAHVVGGKIVEEWQQEDWLGLIQQLGLVQPPGG
jgi:predicted ester cyclase